MELKDAIAKAMTLGTTLTIHQDGNIYRVSLEGYHEVIGIAYSPDLEVAPQECLKLIVILFDKRGVTWRLINLTLEKYRMFQICAMACIRVAQTATQFLGDEPDTGGQGSTVSDALFKAARHGQS